MTIAEAKAIVSAAIPGISSRQLKRDAATYLNWFNGYAEATTHPDPTGEAAVRRVLAQATA